MAGIKVTESDRWFSKCVRHRDNWTCQHCQVVYPMGSRGLECAHIYGRRHKSVRWDPDNAVSLCTRCHMDFTGEPVSFTQWITNLLGEGHMSLLLEKKNQILKVNKQIRADISKHYREEYRRMEQENTRDLVAW